MFGPVPSRRLGRSLGVDLVPYKTCSYDCVYCQLGRTSDLTLTRREYVPLEATLQELATRLAEGPAPDYITLSGSGEPTLYEPLAALIAGIKRLTAVPVAVLTNGSLLWLPEVRSALAAADLVVPSLDAGEEKLFRAVNRPHPGVSFVDMTAGLVEFTHGFPGRVWLEVFLLAGLTAAPEQVRLMGELIARIEPDRVQLNTVARPPAEPWAQAASPEELAAAQAVFGEHCDVVGDYAAATPEGSGGGSGEQAVLALLQRRPCRLDDLAAGLGLHRNELVKHLEHLLKAGALETELRGTETHYKVTPCYRGTAD